MLKLLNQAGVAELAYALVLGTSSSRIESSSLSAGTKDLIHFLKHEDFTLCPIDSFQAIGIISVLLFNSKVPIKDINYAEVF